MSKAVSPPPLPSAPRFRLRVHFGALGMIGPGKADLLDGIARTGSIAAAGRDMGMSYKRAWQLVETMNAMFRDPLVLRSRGGAKGGGAQITPTGQTVLAHYRAMEAAAIAASQADASAIEALLNPNLAET
ncbi:MAG: LysR family transcriptional regulator [Mangrovicoccus sp.]|nr:LysR family transcriptional regulator [Mangrovicoccus sp.]